MIGNNTKSFYAEMCSLIEAHVKKGCTAEVITGSLFRAMNAVNSAAEESEKQVAISKLNEQMTSDSSPKGMNKPKIIKG